MRAYVDTSVLLRVVLGSPGRLRAWRSISEPMSSELTRVEALRALDRVRLAEELDDAELNPRIALVLEHLAAFTLAGVTRRVLDRAGAPMPSAVGTLDAIHLSTALSLKRRFPDLSLATHDSEIARAGELLGFQIVD